MTNTTIAFEVQSAAAPRKPFASRLGAYLAGFIARRQEAKRIRREVAILQTLDDRTLADIGMNRSQIEGVARFGRN